jgi:outer membrane receptor protein involved in Fe transport
MATPFSSFRRWLRRASLGVAALVSSWTPEAAGQSPATDPPPPAAGNAAPGGDAVDIEDSSLEGLLDLTLEERLGKTEAVTRTNESVLRAPASMTTLEAAQLRLSGATNVADVLRAVPGVAVVRQSPGNYVVSLRGTGGLAGNNVIVLVDGIPLNNPMDGTAHWDLVPLHVEDIERIEVVRGPVSPTYGANAYTGVVNIVLRRSIGLSPGYAARVRTGIDTAGGKLANGSGRFVHVTPQLELRGFLSTEWDGTSVEAVTPGRGENPWKTIVFAAQGSLRLERASRLSLDLGRSASNRSGQDHLALLAEAQDQHMWFGRVLYELTPLESLLGGLRLWAQGVAFELNAVESQTGFSYVESEAYRGAAGTDLVLTLSPWFSVTTGGQLNLEQIKGAFVHPNVDGQSRPSYGFYAGLKAQPLDVLDLTLTGRGDQSPISARLEYSARASAVYHQSTWGVRLTAATAFRSPTYVEAAGRFVDPANNQILLEGNASLEAPRNTSLELGTTFSPNPDFTLSGTLYWSRLTRLMIEDFESVVRRSFRNDAEARDLLGVELEARWRMSDGLTLTPSLTWLEWLSGAQGIDTNVGVPDQNAQLTAGLRLHGLLSNETWGYGLSGAFTSARQYNVRAGIPPQVLSRELAPTTHVDASIERQLIALPSLWLSLRLGARLPAGETESPLPFSTQSEQRAIIGVEVRRD